MNKAILFSLLLLLVVSSYAANTFSIYGNSGFVRINTTGSNGSFVCLSDGTNCPSSSSGGSGYTQWNLAASNGTAGPIAITNNTLVQFVAGTNIIITRNGTSIVINSTATGGGSGSGGTTADWLSNWSTSNIGNFTGNASTWNTCLLGQFSWWNGSAFGCGNDNTAPLTLSQWLVNWSSSNIGNWTRDQPSYVNFSVLNQQNNFSLAQIIANIMNWSQDRPSYINFTILNQQNNLSLGQISANLGNLSNIANQVCYSNGSNCGGVNNGTSRGGNVSGGGSTNFVPLWSNSTDLRNSIIQDGGVLVNISGNMSLGVGGNITSSLSMAGQTLIINVSTIVGGNGRVGIDIANPETKLHINGSTKINGELNVTGISSDGAGDILCIKADGNIGTCSVAIVGVVCTCG